MKRMAWRSAGFLVVVGLAVVSGMVIGAGGRGEAGAAPATVPAQNPAVVRADALAFSDGKRVTILLERSNSTAFGNIKGATCLYDRGDTGEDDQIPWAYQWQGTSTSGDGKLLAVVFQAAATKPPDPVDPVGPVDGIRQKAQANALTAGSGTISVTIVLFNNTELQVEPIEVIEIPNLDPCA